MVWFLQVGLFRGGGSFSNGIYTYGTSNGVLKANWGELPSHTYTIQFDANGGTGSVPSTISKTIKEVEPMGDISSTQPTRDGYTFRGWSASPNWNDKRISYLSITAWDDTSSRTTNSSWTYADYCNYTGGDATNNTLTLYAQWELGCTLYYYGNGATSGSVKLQNFYYNDSVTIRENNFVREGYVFTGWNTRPNGNGTNYNVGQAYNLVRNMSLYAQWVEAHKLTIQPNGGTWNGEVDDITFDMMKDQQMTISIPTRDGYRFTGWTKTDIQVFPEELFMDYSRFIRIDSNYNDTGDALYIRESGYLFEDYIDADEISDTVSYIDTELHSYLVYKGNSLQREDSRVKLVEIDGENVYAFALSKDEIERYKDYLICEDYVYDEETGELLPRYNDMWTRTLDMVTITDLPQKPESEPEKPTYEKVIPQCSCNGSHSYTSLSLEVDNGNRLYYECLNGNKTYIIRDYKDLNCPVCSYNDDLYLNGNVYFCEQRRHDCIFFNCNECNSPNTVVNYDGNDKLVIVECSDCSIEYVYSLRQICGVCNNDSSIKEVCRSCGSNNFRDRSSYCLICRRDVTKKFDCSEHGDDWIINVLSDVKSSQKIADDYYIYCNDCGKMYLKCNDNDYRYFYGNEGVYCPIHDDIDCLVCINCSSTDIRKEKKKYTSFYCLTCKSSDYIKDYNGGQLGIICDKCYSYNNIILLAESNNSCTKAYYFNKFGELELLPLTDNSSTHVVPAIVYGANENVGSMTSLTEEAIFTMGEVDVILTANWEKIPEYTVYYNGNSNDGGSTDSQTFLEGDFVEISENGFTKLGHVFTEWNTESDGTGVDYTVGEIYNEHLDLNLFAQWRISKSTLVIDPNGGVWNSNTTAQTFTQEYNTSIEIDIPTREGYTFIGWSRSGNYGSITSLTSKATYTFGPHDNVTETLTARWDAIKYSINYNKGETNN